MSVKCVMSYTEGDGCTYSCDHNFPFEYESVEAALVDFERLMTEARATVNSFKFCGQEFYADTFVHRNSLGTQIVYLPDFFTLDEWFETQKIG